VISLRRKKKEVTGLTNYKR